MNLLSQCTISAKAPVTGMILAGGASRRMGRPKALLPWGKSSLLHHLTSTMEPRLAPLIVVTDGKMAFPALPSTVHLVDDTVPHQGPLAGFSYGLKYAPGDRPIFLTGCDFPFIQPTIIDYLLDQMREADAIVAQSANIVQPLVGLYQPRIMHAVDRLIATGIRSMTSMLEIIDCKKVTDAEWSRFDPSGVMLMNINTPEDYEQAHQQFLKVTSSKKCS